MDTLETKDTAAEAGATGIENPQVGRETRGFLAKINALIELIGEAGREAREEGYPAHVPVSDHFVIGGH